MERAVNPQTGEVVFLVNNQWVKPTQTAQNPKTGEMAYLVGNSWQVVQAPAEVSSAAPTSPEELLTPPVDQGVSTPKVKPGGFQPELVSEQFKAGVSGLQEGYYANTAKNNAALLNIMDRIDRGEQVRPIDDPLGYADMDAATKKTTRDALQSALTGTVAKTISYGAERQGYKRNENADLLVSLADKGDLKGAFQVFTQDPIGIIQQLSVESAPNALPSLVGGAAGILLKGGVAGLMTGLATGSFPVEFMASITDSLRESGVDLKDSKAVEAKLRDPKFLEDAGKRAVTRGTVIATADAASGKLLMPFKAGQLGKNAARAVGNVGTEAGLEMVGEAAAQSASSEELKLGQVIAEGLGAGPQAAVATALRSITEGGRPPEEAPPTKRIEPEITAPVKSVEVTGIQQVPDSVFSSFPDLNVSDYGLISLNQFTAEERKALTNAGLVEIAKDKENNEIQGVDPEKLWPERQRRSKEAAKTKTVVDQDEINVAIEKRAQNYDKLAQEQENLGDLGDAEKAAEYRAKAKEIRLRKVAPSVKGPAPVEPTVEPKAVTPAFRAEEIEGEEAPAPAAPPAAAPPAPDQAEVKRLEADLAKVQKQQLDPTIDPEDPRLEEFQRQEADIKAKLAELRGEVPVGDLYDQLVKATPQELKKIDVPLDKARDLYIRLTEDQMAGRVEENKALETKLNKLVNKLGPDETPELKAKPSKVETAPSAPAAIKPTKLTKEEQAAINRERQAKKREEAKVEMRPKEAAPAKAQQKDEVNLEPIKKATNRASYENGVLEVVQGLPDGTVITDPDIDVSWTIHKRTTSRGTEIIELDTGKESFQFEKRPGEDWKVSGDVIFPENPIIKKPTKPEETVRLYRAESDPNAPKKSPAEWVQEDEDYKRMLEASGRWFTDDLAEAQWYLENEYPGGRITYIDVPKSQAEAFRVSKMAEKPEGKKAPESPRAFSRRPEKEFFVTKEMAAKRKPIEAKPVEVTEPKEEMSAAEKVKVAEELLDGLRFGEPIDSENQRGVQEILGISRGFDAPVARRLMAIAKVPKAIQDKVMSQRPVTIDDLSEFIAPLVAEKTARANDEKLFAQAKDAAKTNEEIRNALNIYDSYKNMMDAIATERGKYGVKWAERNVSARWVEQSQKAKKAKQRVIELMRKQPVKKPAEKKAEIKEEKAKANQLRQEVQREIAKNYERDLEIEPGAGEIIGDIKTINKFKVYKIKYGSETQYRVQSPFNRAMNRIGKDDSWHSDLGNAKAHAQGTDPLTPEQFIRDKKYYAERDAREAATKVEEEVTPVTPEVEVKTEPATEAKKEEHVEAGESEPITKPVIQEAVTKGADKKDIDYTAMRREVERQVDEAIAKSPYETEKDWDATYKSRQNFVTFDIPGDGKFKIKNNKERLQEFKKRLMAAVKPKQARGPQFTISPADVNTTLRDLVDANEIQAAIEFAELKGIKISESKLDLKQKLKVQEYQKDPEAFEKKAEAEAALTEAQRQAMAEAEEKRRIETNKRLAAQQEREEKAKIDAYYETIRTGSNTTASQTIKAISVADANKVLEKIDEEGEIFPENRLNSLQKKAGIYRDTRWREYANSMKDPGDTYEIIKKLSEKVATPDGTITLHELIEKEIDSGSKIITLESGERLLGTEEKSLSEKKISRIGMDYAGYLLKLKSKEKPAKAEKLTDEQKENAQTHADETGGEVVFQKGDYALIRGYSMMTGDPVYVPTSKTQRGRVDIENFTGTQIPSDVKQEMIMFKRQAERDAEEKHKSNPFIKFDRGIALSEDIPGNLAGVIRGWKDLLKLNVPVYVSTIEDAKKNRNNFTGPHRRVGSGTLDEKERGSVRRMADGSYYILFEKSVSPTFMLEIIAHEMGHLHERLVYEKATPEQKAALKKAHEAWLKRQEGKMAQDLVEALRARATGRRVKAPADQTVEQMTAYWKSFGEWYADQVSRWAVTAKSPVGIVEKFFKRLANQLRNFYQKLKNAKYLPDETFVQYIEEVTKEPANLAPPDQVIDDTPERMRDFDNDETQKIDDLMEKYERKDTPLSPSGSVKERLLNTYQYGKNIRDAVVESPLAAGKNVLTAFDRQLTKLRNENIYYGTGVEQEDIRRYAGQLRDSEGQAVASIAVVNALHAGHIGTQVMVLGGLEYNTKTLQFNAVKRDKSIGNVVKEKAKLISRLGAQRAANVIQAYFEAKRSRSIVNEFLEREKRYNDLLDAGEPIEEAQKQLNNIEIAMSKVRMDDEQIDEFIALEKEYPELRAMMDNWTAVNQNMLDMLYFSGNLSKTVYKQLKAIKDYVPWQRIMDDQEHPHTPTSGIVRGLTNVAKEKRFKFGEVDRDINDIVDNMINNVMMMTKNSMRTYATNRMVDEYGIRNENGKIKVFPKEGVDSDGVKFNVIRNGRRIVVGIEDPLIAQAVLGMENVMIPMNKALAAMANLFRRTITTSGVFQIKQLFMDAPTAAWVSGVKNPFAVWGGTFAAFLRVLTNTDPIAQKLRAAGIGGFMSTARTPEQELALEIGLMNKSMYSKFLRVLDHIGDASDYAQRVAIYKQVLKETKDKNYQDLIKKGMSKTQAAKLAQGDEAQALLQANNVIDFLKHGSGQTAQALTRTVSFMNAYAQQGDVLLTTLAGGGLKGMKRAKVFRRMLTTYTLLSATTLIYCFLVGDDEDYEKMDDNAKLRNLVIPGSKKYLGEIVALPMHTSASFFFKAIPELLYNTYIREGTKDETDARRFRKALKDAAVDSLLGPNPVPTGVKPFIEIGLNKNFWTGTSIIPRGMENLAAAEQYNASTSELGKIVSAMTSIPGTEDKRGLSPIEADHMMRGLLGSVASMAMWASNLLAADRPEARTKDIPVLGAFVVPTPRGREDLFYDLKDETDEKMKTYKKLLDREKFEEAEEYFDKNEGILSLYKYTNKIDNTLKKINKEIQRVGTTSSEDITPKERREQMDDLGELKNDILEDIAERRTDLFGKADPLSIRRD